MAYGVDIVDADHVNSQQDAVNALIWAVDSKNINVVNMSEGFEIDNIMRWTDRAFDYWARWEYATIVKSAGNSAGSISSPGKAWNIITVGGSDDADTAAWSDDDMYSASAYDDPSGREKPEVVAPAVDITSISSGGNPVTDTGTSYAAPQVAGLAALLMDRDADLRVWPEAVKPILMASAVHNIEGNRRLSDKDGAGSIDGVLADNIAQNGYPSSSPICDKSCWWGKITTSSDPLAGGAFYRYFKASQGERIRIAISWFSNADTPSNNYSFDRLDTNYNLYIYKPGGGGTIAYSVSEDNNYELVDFIAPETGQYTIQIYRSYSGDNNEPSNSVGIAWSKQATYLPDVRSAHNGWDTAIYVRNDGAQPKDVTITVFNENGSMAAGVTYPSLPANSQWYYNPSLSNWRGSAVVDASEDVSVIVESQYGTEESVTNYNGIASTDPYDTGWGKTGTIIYVPAVKRASGGRTGQFYIFNTGSGSATVTPSFKQKDNGSSYACSNITIPAMGRYIYHPASCSLPGNQFYGAKLTSNQPLAVLLVEQDDSGNPRAATSNGFSAGASPNFIPLVKSGWYGNDTGLAVQNVGANSATVNVTFYDRDSAQTWSTSYALDPLSSHSFWVPNTVPSGKIASARLTTTPQQDLVATVYEAKTGQDWRMQHNGFLVGSNTVILPRIVKTSSWITGFQVQNVGGANASVTVRYYDANGNTNASWNQTATIASYEAATFAQAQHAALPNPFYGSAIITANQPIVAEVNFASGSGSNDKSMSYSGFNR